MRIATGASQGDLRVAAPTARTVLRATLVILDMMDLNMTMAPMDFRTNGASDTWITIAGDHECACGSPSRYGRAERVSGTA